MRQFDDLIKLALDLRRDTHNSWEDITARMERLLNAEELVSLLLVVDSAKAQERRLHSERKLFGKNGKLDEDWMDLVGEIIEPTIFDPTELEQVTTDGMRKLIDDIENGDKMDPSGAGVPVEPQEAPAI